MKGSLVFGKTMNDLASASPKILTLSKNIAASGKKMQGKAEVSCFSNSQAS